MEIQRHANVPPLGVAHRAMVTTNLFGYIIPKGTIVMTSLYSIHMDSDYWGDPENFRPERFFEGDRKKNVPEKNFAPFGYGKRRCLGESLARANYFYFFTALLHNFKVCRAEGEPEPSLKGFDGVTVSPKPFKVVLEYRND